MAAAADAWSWIFNFITKMENRQWTIRNDDDRLGRLIEFCFQKQKKNINDDDDMVDIPMKIFAAFCLFVCLFNNIMLVYDANLFKFLICEKQIII